MRTHRLFVVVALLTSTLGCESKVPPDALAGGPREARVRDQVPPPVDGGGVTATQTVTGTTTTTGTQTTIVTQTNAVTLTVTSTVVGTLTQNTTITVTGTNTTSATATQTATATATATATQSYTATQTSTATKTQTATQTSTSTKTQTATQTATVTSTSTGTRTTTSTTTSTATQTQTSVQSYTQNYVLTGTVTSTNIATVHYTSWAHSVGNTVTATTTAYVQGTGSKTVTGTVTGSLNGTATKTVTASMSAMGSSTGSTTVTVSATVTTTSTNAGTGSRTATTTRSATGNATQSWTYHPTATVTSTTTKTATSTVTNTTTATTTKTVTNATTTTQTTTITATATVTNTGTSTNTRTVTNTSTVTRTITVTNTGTATNSHTATGTATSTQVQTVMNTTTGTSTQTAAGTNTVTNTVTTTVTETITLTNTGTTTQTDTATSSDGGNPSCTASNLVIQDLGDDIRDIWSGREAAAMGKRVDPHPTFTVTFSQAVEVKRFLQSTRLAGLVTGDATTGLPGACRAGIIPQSLQTMGVTAMAVGAEWGAGSVGPTDQRYPGDFDAFVFGDVSQVPDSHGSIAAGGNITLQNFSVNQLRNSGTGLVAKGALTLSQGTVVGDVYVGGQQQIASSVNLQGQVHTNVPIDFVRAHVDLTALSQTLAGYAATATASVQPWGILLQGANSGLNVFSLQGTSLSQAGSVQISAPAGATVIVNVMGQQVSMQNAGISIGGTDKKHVLWNLPEAASLSLASLSFQGSVLAPEAAVTLSNGNIEGTLVAGSLTGNGELHGGPFTGWGQFPLGQTLTFRPTQPLMAGCQYTLTIDQGPLVGSGTCLAAPTQVSFVVDSTGQSRFFRETEQVVWDGQRNVTSFALKAGVNMTVGEVFARYSTTLGLRSDTDALQPASLVLKSSTVAGHDAQYYRQYYRDVPLEGRGMFVHFQTDNVRLLVGQLAHNLDTNVTPTVTAAQAVHAVVAILGPSPHPWEADPTRFATPAAQLMLLNTPTPTNPDNFVLGWRVQLLASGVPFVKIDVDAATGALLNVQSNSMGATCPGFVSAGATLKQDASDATADDPTYTSVALKDSIVKSGGTEYHLLFSDPVMPPDYGKLRIPSQIVTRTDFNKSADDASKYPTSIDDLLNSAYCDNDGNYTATEAAGIPARAHWAAQRAEGMASNFTFAGKQWMGIGGTLPMLLHLIVDPNLPEYTCGSPDSGCKEYSSGRIDCGSTGCQIDPTIQKIVWTANLPYTIIGADTTGVINAQGIIIPLGKPFQGQGDPVWLGTIGHEYGHAILNSARNLWIGQQILPNPNATYAGLNFKSTGESRAIQEGFGDLLGAAVARNFDPNATWTEATPVNLRDMAAPEQSQTFEAYSDSQAGPIYGGHAYSQPKPSTYKCGSNYKSGDTEYDGYMDATVFTHWAYLMVEGGDGTNDCGCSYHVAPLPVDPSSKDPEADRLNLAAKIAFQSLAENVGDAANFDAFRAATLAWTDPSRGNVLDGVKTTVAQAWRAVGIDPVAPANDYYWPAEDANVPVQFGSFPFEWEAAAPDDWQFQVSKDPTFSSTLVDITVPDSDCLKPGETSPPCSADLDGSTCDTKPACRYAKDGAKIRGTWISKIIQPGQLYYWRAKPVGVVGWPPCDAVHDFTTKNISVEVLSPPLDQTSIDTYLANWFGQFTLGGGSTYVRFYAQLSTDPTLDGTCSTLTNKIASDVDADGKWLGNSALTQLSSPDDDKAKYTAFPTPNAGQTADQTYYLEVIPVSALLSGNGPGNIWEGKCVRIPFKVRDFAPPVPISPGSSSGSSPTTVDQGSDVIFYWTPTNGATGYHLVLYQEDQRNDAGQIVAWGLSQVYDKEINAADAQIGTGDHAGQLYFRVPGINASNSSYTHVWMIYAIDSSNGEEVSTYVENAYPEYGIISPAPQMFKFPYDYWLPFNEATQVTVEWTNIQTTDGYRLRAFERTASGEETKELASPADNWVYGSPCSDGKQNCLSIPVAIPAKYDGSNEVCFEVWGVNDPCNHFEGKKSAPQCVWLGAGGGKISSVSDEITDEGGTKSHVLDIVWISDYVPGITVGTEGGFVLQITAPDKTTQSQWVPKVDAQSRYRIDTKVCADGDYSIAITAKMSNKTGYDEFWTVSQNHTSKTPAAADSDGDGYTVPLDCYPGPFDCDDSNKTTYPGASVNCTDGKDHNCNGKFDKDEDACKCSPTPVNCTDGKDHNCNGTPDKDEDVCKCSPLPAALPAPVLTKPSPLFPDSSCTTPEPGVCFYCSDVPFLPLPLHSETSWQAVPGAVSYTITYGAGTPDGKGKAVGTFSVGAGTLDYKPASLASADCYDSSTGLNWQVYTVAVWAVDKCGQTGGMGKTYFVGY